ncbi:hypothetical protein [Subtercola boreus]|uniref:Uncharacterized protein n=1 Tax=Subtercola boreus TaxID=120213 RepID=A0A3E0WCD8_9MICO|nr:hypothetical protein [Subtercola boreus]RFA21035.1 hypothetical protein B7R24_06400 [Subtercola boreus]RFA21419.1 hypothetical protein B7R23_06345 [Subtercola boreus]RFA27390.1 hypothetical protein B7R25_06470 [Subtercola boreus]
MFSILTRTLRLVAARWPQLLAWYLTGWLARYLLIELAAFFGATSALMGLLLMPLAILARLGSYIAMFLVLRPALPGFVSLRDKGEDAVDRTTAGTADAPRQRLYDILLVSILPFFAFYAAWQLLKDDTQAYAQAALKNIDFFAGSAPNSVLSIEFSPVSVGVIVLAFAGRFLIKRYSDRLPRWTNLVAVYLEAVWVYLTLFLITNYQQGFQTWLADRQAMRWLDDTRQAIVGVFAPFETIYNAVQWAINETGGLVLLPLAWLTLAGIVYGRALAAPRVRLREPRNRLYTGARTRFNALPPAVSNRLKDLGADWAGRWRPFADALLLIWRAGVVPMGIFILGYTVLESASAWLDFAAVRIIGPHDLGSWWMNFDQILSFVVDVIVEPLRLCLVAAAYNFCLVKLEERREVAAAATGTAGSGGTAGTADARGSVTA